MNKIELRELLHQEYKTENWKKITEFVFPNVSYLQKPQEIPIKNYDGVVESFKQLGNVKLHDGKNLALFEVRVSESVNIPFNRVKLRKLVTPYIDQEHNHGVLVIYEQGKENYRFTFTAKSTEFDEDKGDFVNIETDEKRYTYVLGKNESCKTAADRFFDLAAHKNEADISAVQEAFSVEKLSKQFFKEYKDHYEKFVGYLMASASYHTAIFKADDKAIRDFVKILLGRLVFIQFVQKKRWMGVPTKAHGWHDGEADFLFRSFRNFQHKGLFYSDFLEPLFYEALSKPNRPNDIFSVTGTKVPFLNGGLFEKEETDTSLVNFPETFFNDLLEFFDKYNFTINEYDPIDHEIGIDPEMLGSIFENLLEDNKDKGAFYTPKEVVHFMCQESLKEYLKTYLQEKNVWIESNEFEKALEAFVKKKEAGGVIDFDEVLATGLRDVKICDPAIGSGAFPMGLLNEIYHCVFVLFSASPDVVGEIWKMDKWAPDVVKKNIIQNSIYGVDIEKGAVDIARLRFWLSLIIDETEPHALPNLDYKIVVGNSLVSKFDGECVEIDWIRLQNTGDAHIYVSLIKPQVTKLASKQRDYFDPKNKNKKQLASEIRNLKIELLINQLSFNKELYISKTFQKGGFMPLASDIKHNTERELQIQAYDKHITKLKYLLKNTDEPFKHFDWNLDFPEVLNPYFTNDKGGFDIVIANPPYIKEYTNRGAFDGFRQSEYYRGKMDIWYGFACTMLDLLKPNGIECFIAQNNWITSSGSAKLRNKIVKETEMLSFIDFGNYKVFQSAGIQTMIYVVKKTIPREKYSTNYSRLLVDNIEKTFLDYFLQSDTNTIHENFEKVNFEFVPATYMDGYITFANYTNESILKKIQAVKHINLDEKEIATGIQPNPDVVNARNIKRFTESEIKEHKINVGDGVFVVPKDKFDKLSAVEKKYIKPVFEPKEVQRYKFVADYESEILYITKANYKNDAPNLLKHLSVYSKIMEERRENQNGRLTYYHLQWPRDENFFKEGEKVLSVRKCERPTFIYTIARAYVMLSFNVIRTERVNLKYLTALLNSKLIAFWLKNKGKMQGNIYQIDKEPLLAIPICEPTEKVSRLIGKLVTKILDNKTEGKNTITLEQEIDNLVYKLYNLTYSQVKIIDPEFALGEEEFSQILNE